MLRFGIFWVGDSRLASHIVALSWAYLSYFPAYVGYRISRVSQVVEMNLLYLTDIMFFASLQAMMMV